MLRSTLPRWQWSPRASPAPPMYADGKYYKDVIPYFKALPKDPEGRNYVIDIGVNVGSEAGE
jgi:hypothetical protein